MKEATLKGVAFSLLKDSIGAPGFWIFTPEMPSAAKNHLRLLVGSPTLPPDAMIELFQFPWSPYCLVQRRILEYSGVRHKLVDLPPSNRAVVWKLTKERYYQLPVLRDGRNVVFEIDENSQVIAKYLDDRLRLNLFPHSLDGIQDILWRYIDNDVEAITFKLNDAYFQEFVPKAEQLAYRRHKERKFGRHCLEQWREQENSLLMELEARTSPFEQMLAHRDFLLDEQPRFVDFDLWGILANALYSGHHRLPAAHSRLRKWHRRMTTIKFSAAPVGFAKAGSEKLHSRHQRSSPRPQLAPQFQGQ